MNTHTLLFLLLISSLSSSYAQINYTANDVVPPYNGVFRPGSNFGLYPGFTDEMLGTLAGGQPELGIPGVGAKALRPGLFEHFTYDWGYDIRIPTFQHYIDIGLEDNTVIVGFPAEAHREYTEYCPGVRSEMFANLYEPVWDNGENGTPINENNYYAAYLWNIVTRYKDYVRFYEIWNEPGFDYTGGEGWRLPGEPGNWWDNDPNPCSYKLRAPIYSYIRMLRISYEIVKSLDPQAYVVVAGAGFPSFLDALLRNTDNPNNGEISAEYPLTAGAYFDVLGMHSYPHFDGSLREWSNEISWFRYFRHSDAAAQGLAQRQAMFQQVLDTYGYDGNTFPKKLSTITECNIPRQEFGEYMGSTIAQRNFIMKAVVTCMQNDIHQLHVFQISERSEYEQAVGSFDVMGLYKKFNPANGMNQIPTEEGIALRTTMDMLFGKTFDEEKTISLNLPENIGGGAFRSEGGDYTYMLWAKTENDRSEIASKTYSFPQSLTVSNLQRKEWNYTESLAESTISSQNIPLTSTPIFLTEKGFDVSFLSTCTPGEVQFSALAGDATTWEWSFEGGTPANSNLRNPNVTYENPGLFKANLVARNSAGNVVTEQNTLVEINQLPQASFANNLLGTVADFTNTSDAFAEEYFWDFGDGTTSTAVNPNHIYARNGTFTVSLTVSNSCGSTTATQTVTVNTETTSRLSYTANDTVPIFPTFRPGVNINYYPPWTDEQIADIAAGNPILGIQGAGAKSLRMTLTDEFFGFWGYDVRSSTFNHYESLNLQDNSVVLGYPSAENRSYTEYCPGNPSSLFKNMYLDIWDNGENGTPINDENTYAVYLYNTVLRYRDQVTFWEIWNSPDLEVTGDKGWLESGEPGNWWDNNPEPCDYQLHAPISHYIRLLRISYEIIKQYDSDAFVTVSGIAFPAFLDAILRNTDNPIDGSAAQAYPLRGGAYFDALGFVAFPHLDGSVRYYDHSIQTFRFTRHSDAAITGIERLKNEMSAVLEDYGYGANFPAKAMLISRANVPRRQYGDYLGGDELQRNYLMKGYIEAMRQDLQQFQVYQIGETAYPGSENSELELMGLYQPLTGQSIYQQQLTPAGLGFKTTSDLLFGKKYDAQRSAALDLPSTIDGIAVVDSDGYYTYVLWAKTREDRSEVSSATYSFPTSLNLPQLERREWNWAQSTVENIIAPNNISLTGTPLFLTEVRTIQAQPIAAFTTGTRLGCPDLTVDFIDISQHAESWSWTFEGGIPATSTEQNPSVTYPNSGTFAVTLTVQNEAGQNTVTESNYIEITTLPTAEFVINLNGNVATFTNLSTNADGYFWSFGDGRISNRENPTHEYLEDGFYAVQLIAENGGCQADTFSQNIIIESNATIAAFRTDNAVGCPDLQVQFTNQSSNAARVEWLFAGGNPTISDEPNPVITYDSSGIFAATLIAINGTNRDTFTIENAVEVLNAARADFDYTTERFTLTFNNLSQFAESSFWDFGDGTTSFEANPVHTFERGESYLVKLTVTNSLCGSHTIEKEISFAPAPTPQFSTVNNTGCPPLEVQFFDESEGATDWEWSFPGGDPAISNEQNPIVVFREPGNFSITLDARNASGNNALSFFNAVKVDTGAVANFEYIVEGITVQFENTSSYGQSYEWQFGDGTSSTDSIPVHSYDDNGDYEVQLAAYNLNCDWDTLVKTVTIAVPPITNFEFTSPSDCDNLQVTFTDRSRYSPLSYRWFFEGASPSLSDEANPVVTYLNSGTYSIILITENEAGRDTLEKEITIQSSEFAERTYSFCDNETLSLNGITYDASTSFATQILDDQNGACDTTLFLQFDILPSYRLTKNISIFQGQNYVLGMDTLTRSGKYQAKLTSSQGCDSLVFLDLKVLPRNEGLIAGGTQVRDAIQAKISTHDSELLNEQERNVVPIKNITPTALQTFPNPFENSTTIQFELAKNATVRISVYDALGREITVLKEATFMDKGFQQIVWDASKNFVEGVYWIKVKVDEIELWKRVIKGR